MHLPRCISSRLRTDLNIYKCINQNISLQITYNPWVIWKLFITIISVNISYSQSVLKFILEAWWSQVSSMRMALKSFCVRASVTHRSVSEYVNSEIIKWLLGCQQCDCHRRNGVHSDYPKLEKRNRADDNLSKLFLAFFLGF